MTSRAGATRAWTSELCTGAVRVADRGGAALSASGAGGSLSRGAGSRRLESRGLRSRAFTLIELLVVIMVIGILASIVMPVLGKAKLKAMKEWARKEITELGSALDLYHQDHGAYPPDTQDWGLVGGNDDNDLYDEYTIRRYLGMDVVDRKGKVYTAYYGMDSKRLGSIQYDARSRPIGKFLDPFLQPYEVDAMHMIPPDLASADPAARSWRQSGWPYRAIAMPGEPTHQELRRMVLMYKLISRGPDQLTVDFPCEPDPSAANLGDARDDIRPWE